VDVLIASNPSRIHWADVNANGFCFTDLDVFSCGSDEVFSCGSDEAVSGGSYEVVSWGSDEVVIAPKCFQAEVELLLVVEKFAKEILGYGREKGRNWLLGRNFPQELIPSFYQKRWDPGLWLRKRGKQVRWGPGSKDPAYRGPKRLASKRQVLCMQENGQLGLCFVEQPFSIHSWQCCNIFWKALIKFTGNIGTNPSLLENRESFLNGCPMSVRINDVTGLYRSLACGRLIDVDALWGSLFSVLAFMQLLQKAAPTVFPFEACFMRLVFEMVVAVVIGRYPDKVRWRGNFLGTDLFGIAVKMLESKVVLSVVLPALQRR
jgi:hypothetical protein